MERSAKVSLFAQVNGYVNEMQRASAATLDVSASAQATRDALERQNQAMERSGAVLAATGAVALATVALTAKAAIDWETAWAGVTKTVDATPEQLARIEDGLRGLAKELPSSHQEIAAVAEAAGQLGVKSADVVEFTRTMVDLGETTNLTADEASTAIAQLMNVMKTAPEDVDRLGAALVALGNNGASTERDIIFMAQRISGAGAVIGLSEAEVLGFANALASVGVEVEAGGSAISSVMIDIAKAVSAGGKDLDGFAAAAGVSSAEFAKTFKGDPAEAVTLFVEGLGRMNAAGGDVFGTLSDLGQSDIRVSRALLSMAGAGDLLRESLKLGADAWEENSALSEEAAKRYETTAAKLDIAKNAVTDMALVMGDAFLPAIKSGADGVIALSNAVGDMPPFLSETAAILGTLAGVAALGGGAFLLAVPKIAEYKIALDTLSTSSMPAVSAAATGIQAATTKTGAVLRSTAAFMMGPWGTAIAAAAVGVKLLDDYVQSLRSSSAEYQNAITTATSAQQLLDVATKGIIYNRIDDATSSVESFQNAVKVAATDPFMRGMSLSIEQLDGALGKIGEELAVTATKNLPAAQHAFSLLAKEYQLTAEQQGYMLDLMPEYRDALTSVAEQQGINVTSSDEAANRQALLALAMEQTAQKTGDAALGLEQVTEATTGSQEAVEEWLKMVAGSDSAFVNLQGAYDAVIQANTDYAQSVADGTDDASDSWQDYYDGFTVNTNAYLDELQRQVDAQNEWEANLVLLSGRVSQTVIDELARMGPEGAPLVAQLVNASDEELARMEGLVAERTGAATSAFANTLNIAAPVIAAAGAQLGQDAAREIATKLANGTSTVEQIMRDYGLKIDGINPTVRVTAATYEASLALDSIITKARSLNSYGPLKSGYKFGEAHGGVVDYFADGGMRENHVAQIAPAGAMRIWAEPETGGEAYIPLAASKRERSVDIWMQTGRRLGVLGYADGAVTHQYAPPAGLETLLTGLSTTDLASRVVVEKLEVNNPVALTARGSTVEGLRDLQYELNL